MSSFSLKLDDNIRLKYLQLLVLLTQILGFFLGGWGVKQALHCLQSYL